MKLPLRILLGGLAGMSAAGPMTVVMLALHRRLPLKDRYPLPPREITEQVLRPRSPEEAGLMTLAAHFAYGGAMGAIYTATVATPARHWIAKGLLAGAAVWAGSYLGLLPATGLLRSAKSHPAPRNALMLLAHGVWGLVLAGITAGVARDAASGGLVAASLRPRHDRPDSPRR